MNKHLASALFIFLTISLVTAGQQPASGQRDAYINIDGSKTPDRISDNQAFNMFFVQLADGPKAPAWVDRTMGLRAAGFSSGQIESIVSAANRWKIGVDALRKKADQLKAESARPLKPEVLAQYDAWNAELTRSLENESLALERELGPAAGERLLAFLREKVKPTMSIHVKE